MKTNIITLFITLLACCASCTTKQAEDPLPSWNKTAIKDSIIHYLTYNIQSIPVEDRIAVFDMDGTLACETPLWFEMYAAINGLNNQAKANPTLLQHTEYQYAEKLALNNADTSVLNHWVTTKANFIDSMVWKAYSGVDHEAYVDSARAYLAHTNNQKYNISLIKTFYQPMIELVALLKEKHFTIYVVSGSIQGVIWSACQQMLGLERTNMIGTRQILTPNYQPNEKKTLFVINKGIYPPSNNKDGKSIDIYSHIGKIPVFAFGNTTGDYGMFRLTSTSKYPHAVFLLNHDDAKREYAYPPYHGSVDSTWQTELQQNHWYQVDMSTAFAKIWIK